MKKLFLLLFFSVLLFVPEVYAQTVINFDNLSADVQVTNQYPGATPSCCATHN